MSNISCIERVVPEELCVPKYSVNFSRIFKLSFFIADYRSLRQVLLYKHTKLHLPELQDSHEHKKWREPNSYGGRWNNGHTQQLGLDRDRHHHGQILHGLFHDRGSINGDRNGFTQLEDMNKTGLSFIENEV